MNQGDLILLVEDDINDALLLRRAFAKAGVVNTIVQLEDGDSAVAYLDGAGEYADREYYPLPCLILLDLKLPRRSGLEVLEWMRAQPGLRRIPVVVLTSSQQSRDINRAYDLGANSYLVKPVGFDTLLEMAQALNLYWLCFNKTGEIEANDK